MQELSTSGWVLGMEQNREGGGYLPSTLIMLYVLPISSIAELT